MPVGRPEKPPRLALRTHTRDPYWYIRYRQFMISTNCKEHQLEEAKLCLAAFSPSSIRRYSRKKPGVAKVSQLTGVIYFISRKDDPTYPVKIGFSTGDLTRRLANIQVGCPHKLAIIARVPAHHSLEPRLHEKLAASRLVGEWFDRSDEVAQCLSLAMSGALSFE